MKNPPNLQNNKTVTTAKDLFIPTTAKLKQSRANNNNNVKGTFLSYNTTSRQPMFNNTLLATKSEQSYLMDQAAPGPFKGIEEEIFIIYYTTNTRLIVLNVNEKNHY